jgi:hypothetical protein
MTSASTADAWRQGGGYPDRSFPGARMPRDERAVGRDRHSRPVRPAVPPRGRPERLRGDDLGRSVPPRREPNRAPRAADRLPPDSRAAGPRPPAARPVPRAAEARGASARGRTESGAETGGGRLRGAVAVLLVFLVTLAGAGVDSFVGVGLGRITLGALLGSATIAALVVRRRDLLSVVVAPPLVFIGVAAVNIGLAPSATFSAPTVATLLIRGFPTMALATGIVLVIALGRLIARR